MILTFTRGGGESGFFFQNIVITILKVGKMYKNFIEPEKTKFWKELSVPPAQLLRNVSAGDL